MKKPLLLASMGAALILSACSNDDLSVASSNDDNTSVVTFTVAQPGSVNTRSFSDGYSATDLYYYVYQTDEDYSSLTYREGISGKTTFDGSLQTTVTLHLINGQTYTALFWAQSPDAEDIFTVDGELTNGDEPTLSIDTDGLVCNTEEYDAFYKYHVIGTVTGNISETITLTRPFAQINFGTDDYEYVEYAGVDLDNLQTELDVSGIYDTMNLLDGTVSNSGDGAYTFTIADIVDYDTETFPVDGYDYLSMNYLLVSEDQMTVDVELTTSDTDGVMDDNVVTVSAVPVQRNYRTNIYGSLLTSTVNYTVEIDPIYEYDEEEGDLDYDVVFVSTFDELQAALTDGAEYVVFKGDITTTSTKPLYVTSDVTIDMAGYDYTYNKSRFYVTTDGISLTIINSSEDESIITTTGHSYAFYMGGSNTTLSVSNVTIASTYSNTYTKPFQIGGSKTSTGNTLTIDNVTMDLSGNNEESMAIQVTGVADVTITNSDLTAPYWGIYQNGTNYVGGSTYTIIDTNITANYSAIYLSSNSTAETQELTVTGGTLTSKEESAIEVKKTNLTVSGAILVSEATTQRYELNNAGSGGVGYGIVLAGYTSSTAYEGEVSLSDITYSLASGNDAINVIYYNGSEGVDYTDTSVGGSDGAVAAE